MLRLIIIIALAFGIYWCYNNINFDSVKNSVSEGVKNEKTIKAVNQGRAGMAENNENAMNGEY